MINRLFRDLSAKSRAKKMDLFRATVAWDGDERVLDIGGQVGGADQVIDLHPRKDRLAAVNVGGGHLERIKDAYPDVLACRADARHLPFADDSFDLVYSNAVIEHVGGLDDQAEMAREIRRVGKSWFITTPNRWYPFEFHTRLPMVGWLPAPWMKRVANVCSYNHIHRRYMPRSAGRTRLMTRRELARMFPDSHVIASRVTFMAETLIVVGPRERVSLGAPRG